MFGAAVRKDGMPSAALSHRIARAAQAAREYPHAPLFCSGGVGRHGPSEASIIAQLLATAVDPARLHLDEDSVDTLQTVRAAARFMKARGLDLAIPCTIATTSRASACSSRSRASEACRSRSNRSVVQAIGCALSAREAIATPYDLVAGIGQLILRR